MSSLFEGEFALLLSIWVMFMWSLQLALVTLFLFVSFVDPICQFPGLSSCLRNAPNSAVRERQEE